MYNVKTIHYSVMIFQVALIDPFLGGVVQLSSLLKQAMETCDYPNTDQPFMCLDLTFIYVLLKDGFGLEPSTNLYVSKALFVLLLRYYIMVPKYLVETKSLNLFCSFIRRYAVTN